MSLVSSPIVYPPSSSPPEIIESRKRPHPPEPRPSAKRRLFGKEFVVPRAFQQPTIAVPQAHDTTAAQEGYGSNDTLATGPFMDEDGGAGNVTATEDIIGNGKECTASGGSLELADAMILDEEPGVANESKFSLSTNGRRHLILKKMKQSSISYERLIAQRSSTAPDKATTSYYGIDVHKLIEEAEKSPLKINTEPITVSSDMILPTTEAPQGRKKNRTMMWTEKYRARKFTDLVGDERTHRTVLRWLKGWDPIVFPGSSKQKVKRKPLEEQPEERVHRKILLLTGAPGLGKTTLAHVCAKQAGYEVVEINASDDRSKEVVRGRIRDCVGTENVRGVNTKIGNEVVRKAGRPVCVVVDEVDGVVGGSSSGGEGGFMKALIDLILLDQKNSNRSASTTVSRKKKGDQFRLLRPMILICNDVYHPSLRPLRSSNLAEIIHIRKPPLDKVVARLNHVFEKEGLITDSDGVRRLCEASWGIPSRKEGRANSNTGEGDMRGVLVVGEWAATKLRASAATSSLEKIPCITRQWVEKHMIASLSSTGSSARGIGRGGPKEAVDRVFLEGAGFPKSTSPLSSSSMLSVPNAQSSVSDLAKGNAISLLRTVLDTCGDFDRVLTDVFATYPTRPFQDDTLLSKPNTAADWLHFHDTLSARIFSGQEWELNPYMSQALLAFHYLFAGPPSRNHSWNTGDEVGRGVDGQDDEEEPHPFLSPRADFEAYEAQKMNRAVLQGLQTSLSIPLFRSFRSPEEMATELVPYLHWMLAPDVKPVVVGGSQGGGTAAVRKASEREMVRRSVEAMGATGVGFELGKVEDARGGYGGFVYRMEP